MIGRCFTIVVVSPFSVNEVAASILSNLPRTYLQSHITIWKHLCFSLYVMVSIIVIISCIFRVLSPMYPNKHGSRIWPWETIFCLVSGILRRNTKAYLGTVAWWTIWKYCLGMTWRRLVKRYGSIRFKLDAMGRRFRVKKETSSSSTSSEFSLYWT